MLLLPMSYECAPFALVFDSSWPLSSCYSLEHTCPSGLRSPRSYSAHSYDPHWCSVYPCARVHSCHTVSPIPIWECERLPRCLSCWFSSFLQHSSFYRSKQLAVFSVPICWQFAASSCPPSATMFGRHTIRHRIRTTPGRLSSSPGFGIFRLIQTIDPWSCSNSFQSSFWFIFPRCLGIIPIVLGVWFLGLNQELPRSVLFRLQCYSSLLWSSLYRFVVKHLYSVLSVLSPFLVVHHYSWQKALYPPLILGDQFPAVDITAAFTALVQFLNLCSSTRVNSLGETLSPSLTPLSSLHFASSKSIFCINVVSGIPYYTNIFVFDAFVL